MPEIPGSLWFTLSILIIIKLFIIREIVKKKKPRYFGPETGENFLMINASEYHFNDSESYTLEVTENAINVIRSDKKPSVLFTLRPYKLAGKDFVFLQVNDFGEGVDLERMVIPLDNILSALEANKLYHIIFSFKGVRSFSELALSVSISHMQRIEDNGGRIIFCEVAPAIKEVMEIMELDKLAAWYVSEAEMVEKETI